MLRYVCAHFCEVWGYLINIWLDGASQYIHKVMDNDRNVHMCQAQR